MAFTYVTSFGNITKSSVSSLAATVPSTLPVGTLVVVFCYAGKNGTNPFGLGSNGLLDSKSNVWTTANIPNANFGIRYSILRTALVSGDTITSQFAAVGGAAVEVIAFSATGTIVFDSGDAATYTTATTAPVAGGNNIATNSSTLVIGSTYVNGPSTDAYTGDSLFSEILSNGTSGQSATSNVTGHLAWRFNTSASNEAYSPVLGTARVASSGIALFYEQVTSTPVTTSDSSSVSISETSSVVATNAVSATDTWGITFTANASISGTASRTDTAALTISDVSSVAKTVFVSTSDTSSVSVADASTATNLISTTDTAAVTVTDTSSNSITTNMNAFFDWGKVADVQTKTAGTTVTVTNTSPYTIPAGALIVWGFACDNPASTTAPTTSVTNNTSGATFNAYLATTRGSGVTTTAGSGIWTYTIYGTIANDVPPGGNFYNLVFNVSVGAKVVIANAFTGVTTAAGSVYGGNSVASTAGTPSAATAVSANAGDLVVGIGFGENTSITGDSDTLNGSWDAQITTATTGSTADTNIAVGLQWKMPNANGIQTYNPTTANDSVAHVGVLISVANSTVAKSTTDAAALTITDATAHNIDVTSIKTILQSREVKRVNIGMLGASLMEGYPCTLDKTVEQFYDAKIRAAFPTSGSPTGIGYAGHSMAYSQGLWSYIASNGTLDATIGWGGRHTTWYAPATSGQYLYANVPSGFGPYTSADINFLAGPSGDPLGFKYSIDGAAYIYVDNYAPVLTTRKIRVAGPINSYILIVTNTGTQNTVINGVTAYKGDENKGIQAHDFGHSGFTVTQWMGNTGGRPNWMDDIMAEDIDYLIISDVGANDGNANGNVANGSAISAATFQTKLSDFIDYIRSFGYTKQILLVAAYDTSYGITFVEPWQNYVTAIRNVATAKGTDFLDLTLLMPASPDPIYSPTDYVHSNDAGDAYRIMAEHFFTKSVATSVASVGDTSSVTITESSSLVITSNVSTSDTASVTITDSSSIAGQYTPITGTESPAVTITDVSSSLITMTRSDTASVTITESSSIGGTAPGQEGIAVTITDVSSALVIVNTTDTSSVSIADVSSSTSTFNRADTAAVTISDTSQPTITMTRPDTAAVTITETSAPVQTTFVNTTDASSVSIADVSAVSGTMSSTESVAVTISETATNGQNNGLSTTDTSAVTITESRTMAISVATSDVSAITITETSASSGTVTTTETSAVTITDASAVNTTVGKPGTDSIAISIAETSAPLVIVSTSDTSSVSIADASSSAITMTRTDTASVTITDSSSPNPQLSRSDTAAVTITESRSLVISTAIITSDTSSVSMSESRTLAASSLGVDGFAISIADTSSANAQVSKTGNDGWAITVADTSALQTILHNQPVVYIGGNWVRGVFKVFTAGSWQAFPVKAYINGNWT